MEIILEHLFLNFYIPMHFHLKIESILQANITILLLLMHALMRQITLLTKCKLQ